MDTDIPAASCMNHKHLLRYIKKKMKTSGNEAVCLSSDGNQMTLNQLFDEMNLTAYELTVDMLDVHVVMHIYFQHYNIFTESNIYISSSKLKSMTTFMH